MQKLQVTLDAAKLRDLVSARNYTNKEGEEITIQEVKFDLIELKEDHKKKIYDHAKYSLIKTHFAVAQQTKEEREANIPPNYIGEGITQVWKNDYTAQVEKVAQDDGDLLPF